jgi:hypothetical protein
MSGPGATRGFTFQFAWAVASSLAVLEGEGETLVVEGAEDVVDVQILGRDDRRLRVSQAKTRQEPYTWNPAALVDVIAAWMHLAEDGEARSEFVTDGSLGPSVVANLVPALRRASEGQLTEDDRAWLRERDLDPDASILGRVTVRSRQPSANELLNGAALQVLRLRDLLGRATVAEAEAVANELYRVASLRSGEADVAARQLTRRDIADIVGSRSTSSTPLLAWIGDKHSRRRDGRSYRIERRASVALSGAGGSALSRRCWSRRVCSPA